MHIGVIGAESNHVKMKSGTGLAGSRIADGLAHSMALLPLAAYILHFSVCARVRLL
jgi:hypothetical protein